ncbi:MAG TPA: invasion associated locus B family protein, partial [Alphaproteobacteria bacterium]
LATAAPAGAADELLGRFHTWDAVATTQGKSKLCYVAGLPTKSEGKYDRRGEASVLVAHWPDQKRFRVLTINAGYEYKKDSTVTVRIDDRRFTLFTKGDTAWTESAAADSTVVGFMKAGQIMTVTGVSARGTETVDTYDLTGMTRAVETIDKACGVEG